MTAASSSSRIRVLPHIRRALDAGAPVVALESSVLAQGLPAPANADAARRMLSAVEQAGATPGITAVVCGEPTIGLEQSELQRFLGGGVQKISSRDLGTAIARRADGATTVAAAIAIASASGIRTFATGGIGGVHREVSASRATWVRDESADLMELARTPMVVVSAGAKSILDLPGTWERLESLGVPVIGFGTNEFPGFYTAKTGIRLQVTVDSASQVARIAFAHFGLGRRQSILVVQPPPVSVALEATLVERAVAAALDRAGREGIKGGEVTPFLLAEVSRQTGGKSLEANLALLEANSRLAGEIAGCLAAGPQPA